MESEFLYRRERRGKSFRYVPVRTCEDIDAYSKGHWLLSVKPGLKSVTRLVTPDFIGLQAAMQAIRHEMAMAIVKGMELRPTDRPNIWLQPCAADAVEAGLRAVMEHVEGKK